MPRIKYFREGQEGYLDFCNECYSPLDMEFIQNYFDISIGDITEMNCQHSDYTELGYLCLKCNQELTKKDNYANRVVGKISQNIRGKYNTTLESRNAFASGFATGQAEKVFLGTCDAAMFRPSAENFEWYHSEVKLIAENFGLHVVVLDSHCPETPHEIWICRNPEKVGAWLNHKINSLMWHKKRAEACGIPLKEIDIKYHLREGFGECCD